MIGRALTMLSDERLAQLAAGGSDPAFAALYSRYSGTLFAYCRSITRNPDDGWDALQNAMIKVLVALRRPLGRSAPVRPWLFCICHNEAIGVLRRRSAAERVAGAATCTTVAGADEQALIREHVTETVSDVQQLPTGQRAALVMRELADLRYDEIAIALETTEGNARQLVFAARAGLRDSRAGRGLPCESVRDQLSLADGRLLRRRSVRAHLRTCDGCREYAVTMRRRAGQPMAALSAWSPFAGYELLQSVFRAAAGASPAAVQGSSSLLGGIAVKAAAAGVLVASGLGAADVATHRGTERSPVASAAAKPVHVARRVARRAPGATAPALAHAAAPVRVTVRLAAYHAPVRHASAHAPAMEAATVKAPAAARSTPVAQHVPAGSHTDPPSPGRNTPRSSPAPARAQADCDQPQAPASHPAPQAGERRAASFQPRGPEAPPTHAAG